MSDPIHIHCAYHYHDDGTAVMTCVVTPDLARQIVALGAEPTPVNDLLTLAATPGTAPIAQPQGDDAAVEALEAVIVKDKNGFTFSACNNTYCGPRLAARAIVAAIRAGKVPGVETYDHTLRAKYKCAVDEVTSLRAQLAAANERADSMQGRMRDAMIEKSEAWGNAQTAIEMHRKAVAEFNTLIKERDEAHARIAEVERLMVMSADTESARVLALWDDVRGSNEDLKMERDKLMAQLAEATSKLASETERRQRYQAVIHTQETTRDADMAVELVNETARADKAETERDEARAEVAALKSVVRKCARVFQWHLGMWQRKDEKMMLGALDEAWAAVGREYCEAPDAEAIRAAGVEVANA